MYGYEEHNDITPEQILQKVTAEQIFKWLLSKFNPQIDEQEYIDFKKRFNSPFREHSKSRGTCRFEVREDNTLLFVDFGDTTTHRTCFKMVMDIYGVLLPDALKIILSHFKLSTDTTEYRPVDTQEYIRSNQPSDSIITFDPTPLERKHLLYINKHLISPQHLIEDNVYPTNKFYIQYPNSIKKAINIYGVGFALDFVDKVKIYQPYSIDYRFITNCDEDNIGNFDNLDEEGEEIVISKAGKTTE